MTSDTENKHKQTQCKNNENQKLGSYAVYEIQQATSCKV